MHYFSPSKIFLFGLVFFCLGIFLGPYFGVFLSKMTLIVIILYCHIIIFFLFFPIPKFLKILIILTIPIFFGIWRYQAFLPKIDENHVGFYVDNGEEYLIEGVIDVEPEERGGQIKIQISNLKVAFQNSKILNLGGKVLVSIPRHYETNYGDKVRFSAKLASPKEYDDFDYKAYLARYGVYAIAKSVDDFEVVDNLSCRDAKFCVSTVMRKYLYKIKNYFSSIIEKIYPEPHAAFMLGILVGEKKGLPDWLMGIFQIIGITHIIAISGYNITILAKVAEKTLGKIGRRYIFWGVIAMIIFFVIMTGAQSSIVRAGIMGGLLVYAGFIGRKSNIINALVFAGTVMIFLNPLILRNDIGFQLSFLATLGLVYISPIFESWLKKIPEFFRTLLSATLAAQVLTMPIIISSFGLVSLISLIANILVLPFIPVSMFLGFLSGILGMIWIPLGRVSGFLGYIVLDFIIRASEFLSRVQYASVELRMGNWWVWGCYYILVSVLTLRWYLRNKTKKL